MRTIHLDQISNWKPVFLLIKFAYNNGSYTTNGIATDKTLYDGTFRSPFYHNEIEERKTHGPNIVDEKNLR